MDKWCKDKCHSEKYPRIFILLVKSMCQKILQKMLLKKMLVQFVQDLVCTLHIGQWTVSQSSDPPTSRPSFFGPDIFWAPKSKIFLALKFLLDVKSFLPKSYNLCQILFLPKHFLTNNFLWQNYFFWSKNFAHPKLFWTQKLFEHKIIFEPKYFWAQIFLYLKFFRTRNFLIQHLGEA